MMIKEIKIGSRVYQINEKSDFKNPNLWGEILYREREIYIKPELCDDEKAITLMHEVLHGALFYIGSKLQKNEEIISGMANVMVMIIRENPELIKYITEHSDAVSNT